MGVARRASLQHLLDSAKLRLRDDGRYTAFHSHGRSAVLGRLAPDQGAGVSLVGEQVVDGRLEPAFSGRGGNPFGIQGFGNVQHRATLERHVKDASGDSVRGRVQLQLWSLFRTVGHICPLVSEGCIVGNPEAARSCFPHSSSHLLREVLRVELIDALDDCFHQLAGGCVVRVLGDRGHSNPATSEHRLERNCVLALTREPRKLPDQNLLERGVRLCGLIEHLRELGTVSDAAGLGLVDVLASDNVAIALSKVSQGSQLGRDGEVDVLPVGGDTSIESGWDEIGLVLHGNAPLG